MEQNINNLIGMGQNNGDIDPDVANIAINISQNNKKISNLGASVVDIVDAEVVSFHMLLDDSNSIETAGNTANVILGQKIFLDTLMDAKKKSNILVSIDCLNNEGNIDMPYTLFIDNNGNLNIPYLDQSNYDPRGGTPLYDRVAEACTQMIAKIQEIRSEGLQERSFLIIVTDGADLHSRKSNASDVKKLITQIMMSETNSVFAIGIQDGITDFKKIFMEMGIPENNIWTPDAMDPKEIRRAFQTMSQSASAAASSTGGFGS